MKKDVLSKYTTLLGLGIPLALAGCGAATAIFNPAFVNTLVGGVVPVTPGPGAAFVFVRAVNETALPIAFIVTIEREVLVFDDNGSLQIDDSGQFVTRPQRETVRLTTQATGQASELGTLFACGSSPVTLVGLGENLLPTDAAVEVGGQGATGAAGFGVSAGNLNPLQLQAGNFNCGDTVIFRAFLSNAVAGGVALQSFLLPGSEQPSIFNGGPTAQGTFVVFEDFLESQAREEGP